MGKFHLREHKNNPNKHKFILNDFDGFRILSTCVTIAYKEIYLKNKQSSFGFVGESRPEEEKKRWEEHNDKKRYNTQRFRVYSLISAKSFSPDKFEHVQDVENSMYFLINIDNEHMTKEKINDRVNEYDLS